VALDFSLVKPRFFGNGTGSNALYVDYLQLDNFATNYNAELTMSQNFTIYFANSNVDPTALEAASGGRIREHVLPGPFAVIGRATEDGRLTVADAVFGNNPV
jgi:hypothetical protein